MQIDMKSRQIKFHWIWLFRYVFILLLLTGHKLQNVEVTSLRGSLKKNFLKSMQNPWKIPVTEVLFLVQLNYVTCTLAKLDSLILYFETQGIATF